MKILSVEKEGEMTVVVRVRSWGRRQEWINRIKTRGDKSVVSGSNWVSRKPLGLSMSIADRNRLTRACVALWGGDITKEPSAFERFLAERWDARK